MMMRDGIFPPGVHKKRTADIHHSQDRGKGWRRRGGRKSDGEEEIKEGTRDVVIQAWGCGLPGCLEDQTAGTKGDGEAMASRKCGLCGKSVFTSKNGRCFYGNPSECYCMHRARWHYIPLKRAWTNMQPGFLWRYKKKKKEKKKIPVLNFPFPNPVVSLHCSLALSHSIFRTHFQILLHLIWNAEIIHLHTECIPPFSATVSRDASALLWSHLRCLLISTRLDII